MSGRLVGFSVGGGGEPGSRTVGDGESSNGLSRLDQNCKPDSFCVYAHCIVRTPMRTTTADN